MLVTLQRSDIIEKTKNVAFEIKTLDNMITRKIVTSAKNLDIPFILSPVQLKILYYLYQKPNEIIYQRDIEKLIESRRSTTSGILDTMEKHNLIKRAPNEIDARTKQIKLTEYSLDLAKKMLNHKEAFDSILINSITKEELDIFFKVTNKIKNNIMNMK